MSHRSDTGKWQRFFAGTYHTAFRYGATLAMLRFAFGLGLLDHSFRQTMKAHKAMRGYREKSGNRYLNRKITIDFFLHQELLPVTNYLLDIETIKKNGVRVFMAAGKRSLDKAPRCREWVSAYDFILRDAGRARAVNEQGPHCRPL